MWKTFHPGGQTLVLACFEFHFHQICFNRWLIRRCAACESALVTTGENATQLQPREEGQMRTSLR